MRHVLKTDLIYFIWCNRSHHLCSGYSEVLIEQDVTTGDVVNVECHGTLSDGSAYTTGDLFENNEKNKFVGQVAHEELVPPSARDRTWWVKSRMEDNSYLLSTGEGFDVWNCIREPKK